MSSGPERPHCDLGSSPDVWHKHKAIIRRLYQDDRKTLREVKYEMENRGFPKNPLSTWETQLRDVLGLRKKFKKKDWVPIHQHVAQRREQGKQSDIFLNNTKIEWKRAWKEMRRSGKLSTQVRQGTLQPLPAGIAIRSPPIRYAQLHEASLNTPTSRVITPEPSLSVFDPVAEAYQSSTDMAMIAASEPQPGQQTVSYAATVFALCLEATPFAQMMLKFQSLGLSEKKDSIASSHSQVRDGFDLVSFDKMSRIIAKSPREQTSTAVLPSSTFLSQEQHTTTISLSFDVSHNLSTVLYILSNNLGYPTGPGEVGHPKRDEVFDKRYQQLSTLIKLISERIPGDGLRSLLHRQQSTIKAAWESLFHYICMWPKPLHLKAAFSFLLDMGIKLEWIDFQEDGGRILYFASLLETDHVPELLRRGCRPDVFDRCWHGLDCSTPFLSNYWSAITVALSKGRVAEARALIQACDVNSAGPTCRDMEGAYWPGPTAFQLFLHEFQPSDHIFHMGLALFLHARADVDMNLCFCPDSNVWSWYRYDELKHNEQHTGVMVDQCNGDSIPALPETPYQFPPLLVSTWPSVTDYLFYMNREAFSVAAKHSRLKGNHVTRASVLRALEVEPDTIRQYIDTRTGQSAIDMGALVRFLLFEQLAIAMDAAKSGDLTLIKRTCQTVRDLVDLVDLSQTQYKQGDVDLVSVILFVIREQPNDDYQSHLISILEASLAAGAPMTSGAMVRAVQLEGRDTGIILRFIPHMDNIRHQGIAALIQAAILNNFQAVDVLVDAGVDLNGPIPEYHSYYLNNDHSVFAYTLCFYTTQAGIEMLRYLIRKGAIPGLHAGVYDTVELLIRYLHNWNSSFDSDASTRKFYYIVDELVDVNDLASNSDRILEACLSLQDLQNESTVCHQIFEALLHRGAKPTSGSLLAGIILADFSLNFVKSLLDERLGFCVNSRWKAGPGCDSITPLQAAASRGHLELVTMLVNRGADINAPARGGGQTALQGICAWHPVSEDEQTRQMDIVRYLIHHAADINAPPCRQGGITALQAVALRGDLQMASLLLQHGADINAPPKRDRVFYHGTALDLAAGAGRLDMVKFLLNAGAISQRRGDAGYDGAIQAAEKARYFVIADSIRRHAADNQTHRLINPELSRPPRDFREYDVGSEEDNEEAEAVAEAKEGGESDTRTSLGQLLLEIRLRAGMNW